MCPETSRLHLADELQLLHCPNSRSQGNTMTIQGHPLDAFQVRLIVSLLARTDMTFSEIAQRRGVSETVVATINQEFEVRNYAALRNQYWTSLLKEGLRKKAS